MEQHGDTYVRIKLAADIKRKMRIQLCLRLGVLDGPRIRQLPSEAPLTFHVLLVGFKDGLNALPPWTLHLLILLLIFLISGVFLVGQLFPARRQWAVLPVGLSWGLSAGGGLQLGNVVVHRGVKFVTGLGQDGGGP